MIEPRRPSLLQALLEAEGRAARDGIVAVDAAGRILYANPRAAEIWGTSPGVVGSRVEPGLAAIFESILDGRDAAVEPPPRDFALAGGRVLGVRCAFARAPDGALEAVVWHLADLTAARAAVDEAREMNRELAALIEGRANLFQKVLDENAERRRIEADLRAANEKLEILARLKAQLLNTVSHELGTPLTPIRLQLHLLKSSDLSRLDDRQRKAIDVIDRNLSRLSQLVQDALDVARLDAGKLKVEPVAMDARQVVSDAVELFEHPARNAGVTLEGASEGEARCVADPRRLTQVVSNLVGNALKFTPKGGTIRVDVRREGAEIVFRVRDTGVGLTKEQMDSLFRPFSQVHDTHVVKAGGTGLGLYISKGIVDQHFGRIWVESEGPGKGSTFAFAIPART